MTVPLKQVGVHRGQKGLLAVQKILQQPDMQDLQLFSLMASTSHKQLKIRLDKVSFQPKITEGAARIN